MRNNFIYVLLLYFSGICPVPGQENTVGMIFYEDLTFDGLTLFSPSASNNVYLIDNCGRIVHSWQCTARPGSTVYLNADGTLYRASKVDHPQIQGAGAGGIIERYDWNNNLIWSYEYSSVDYQAHHDFQILPNGNVLILAWELKDLEAITKAGREISVLTSSKLWPEHIIEVEPTGPETGDIVWEWHVWDHLIQDYDPTKDNYGIVSENPGKIDINYIRPGHDGADWIHANSIDYNAELDQILISSACFDEIWIIDHGITREEAAREPGDLLFRWGNPQTYKRGTEEDKMLFGQHSAHWIPKGLPDENQLLVFNNGRGRPGSLYSSVVKINPVLDDSEYKFDGNGNYLPLSFDWEYTDDPPSSLYSPLVSGAQQLPNGNILIVDGVHGTFIEITRDGEKVWKYINPVTSFGIASQGGNVFGQNGDGLNGVFRAHKYSMSFEGFEGQELHPLEPIELDPDPNLCNTSSLIQSQELRNNIYPNPAKDYIVIEGNAQSYELMNMMGQKIKSGTISQNRIIQLAHIDPGIYLIKLGTQNLYKVIIGN